MANTTVTSDWVTADSAMYFVSSLRGVAAFTRRYSDEYQHDGAKVGNTVKIRLPQQWAVSTGEALVQQNINDQTVNLILNRRRHVGMGWGTQLETTDIQMVRERYIKPAAETLASVYDQVSLGDVYKSVYNSVGTLGTTPSAVLTYSQARVKILDLLGPDTGLVAVLDPLAQATIANAIISNQVPVSQITTAFEKGVFARDAAGIERWFTDQNIPRFTSGAATVASTPLVNGAGQTGSSLVTDGWGSGGLSAVEGDIITLGGVYSVNPLSKESTGRLQQFTLTADVSDTAGAATLSISPSIITSGALQNVTGSPANDATVTYWAMSAGGTQSATVSPQNLVFHPEAFASVMADLVMPNGGANGSRVSSEKLRVSIRLVMQHDIRSDENLSRLDILFGAAPIQERMATRVVG